MSGENMKILVVDDEPDILEFVKYNLEKEGFIVDTAVNGNEGVQIAIDLKPDVILLDIMMPELDGVEVCRKLRTMPEFEDTLIAFLTARNEDFTQIAALDVGGDDFITKPIRPKVLVSRIKALLRRSLKNTRQKDDSNQVINIGDLTIDKEKVVVIQNDRKINLAKKEFELLHLLVSRPGKVFTRQEIFNKIWGSNVIVGNRTIDVHIRKLREKLKSDYIKTVKGIGYKFEY